MILQDHNFKNGYILDGGDKISKNIWRILDNLGKYIFCFGNLENILRILQNLKKKKHISYFLKLGKIRVIFSQEGGNT